MVGRLEVYASHSVDDVEIAIVVLDGFLFGSDSREGAALVLNENGTEVLEVALTNRTAVCRVSTPQSLLVELDVITKHAASNGCTNLSVTHGKRIFHPSVADTCSSCWRVVPKREVVDVAWSCAFLAYTKLRRQHVGFSNEVEDIVGIGCLPKSDFLADPSSAPLIEVTIGRRSCTVPRYLVLAYIVCIGRCFDGKAVAVGSRSGLDATPIVIDTTSRTFVDELKVLFASYEFPQLTLLSILAALCRDVLRGTHVLHDKVGVCERDVVEVLLFVC